MCESAILSLGDHEFGWSPPKGSRFKEGQSVFVRIDLFSRHVWEPAVIQQTQDLFTKNDWVSVIIKGKVYGQWTSEDYVRTAEEHAGKTLAL